MPNPSLHPTTGDMVYPNRNYYTEGMHITPN